MERHGLRHPDNDALQSQPAIRLSRTPHTIDNSLPTPRTENSDSQLPLRSMFLRNGVDRILTMPSDIKCGICTEDDSHDLALKIRRCGHIFHVKCVTPWFYGSAINHDKCPYCRTQLFCPDIAKPIDDDQLLRDIACLARNTDDLQGLRRTIRALASQLDHSESLLELSSDMDAARSELNATLQHNREIIWPGTHRCPDPARPSSPSPATETSPQQSNETDRSLPQEIIDYRERISAIERRFQNVERKFQDLVRQTDTFNPRLSSTALPSVIEQLAQLTQGVEVVSSARAEQIQQQHDGALVGISAAVGAYQQGREENFNVAAAGLESNLADASAPMTAVPSAQPRVAGFDIVGAAMAKEE